MIFEFELVKIKHICDYTNILLVFENDHSTAERIVQEINRTIEMFSINKFDNCELDNAYVDFNELIDVCINYLQEKIIFIRTNSIYEKRIEFDELKYLNRVYR